MTELKKGQHYDEQDPERIGSAVINAVKKHLEEQHCNHSLREIVEDGLS